MGKMLKKITKGSSHDDEDKNSNSNNNSNGKREGRGGGGGIIEHHHRGEKRKKKDGDGDVEEVSTKIMQFLGSPSSFNSKLNTLCTANSTVTTSATMIRSPDSTTTSIGAACPCRAPPCRSLA